MHTLPRSLSLVEGKGGMGRVKDLKWKFLTRKNH